MIRFLRFSDPDFKETFRQILERAETVPPEVEQTVQEILADVRVRGDQALFEYTARFDRLSLSAQSLQVSRAEIDRALAEVDPGALQALKLAAERIANFHRKQKEETWLSSDEPDVQVGQMVRPLDRVGIYVPGGNPGCGRPGRRRPDFQNRRSPGRCRSGLWH
jgi:histidinol dehydrogenase